MPDKNRTAEIPCARYEVHFPLNNVHNSSNQPDAECTTSSVIKYHFSSDVKISNMRLSIPQNPSASCHYQINFVYGRRGGLDRKNAD